MRAREPARPATQRGCSATEREAWVRCWETESATRSRAVVFEGSSVRTSRVSSGMSSVGTRAGVAARGEGVGGGIEVGSRTGVLAWEIVEGLRARFARRKVKKAGAVLVVCLGA